MQRTLLALSAIAGLMAVTTGVVNAQDLRVEPGGAYVGPDHDRSVRGFGERGDNCHVVITHRRGPDGSITTRRRICD